MVKAAMLGEIVHSGLASIRKPCTVKVFSTRIDLWCERLCSLNCVAKAHSLR